MAVFIAVQRWPKIRRPKKLLRYLPPVWSQFHRKAFGIQIYPTLSLLLVVVCDCGCYTPPSAWLQCKYGFCTHSTNSVCAGEYWEKVSSQHLGKVWKSDSLGKVWKKKPKGEASEFKKRENFVTMPVMGGGIKKQTKMSEIQIRTFENPKMSEL